MRSADCTKAVKRAVEKTLHLEVEEGFGQSGLLLITGPVSICFRQWPVPDRYR